MDASVQTAETRGVGAYFTWIQRSDGVNCHRQIEKNMNIQQFLAIKKVTICRLGKIIKNNLSTP